MELRVNYLVQWDWIFPDHLKRSDNWWPAMTTEKRQQTFTFTYHVRTLLFVCILNIAANVQLKSNLLNKIEWNELHICWLTFQLQWFNSVLPKVLLLSYITTHSRRWPTVLITRAVIFIETSKVAMSFVDCVLQK